MNSKQDKEYGKGDDITYYLKLLRILDNGKLSSPWNPHESAFFIIAM
jgi:hypothetical protein